jgi:4a-hydroxytetrahydrobiopterin dehydratase
MKCKPCEGGTKKMQMSAARRYLPMVNGWKLGKDMIKTDMKFKNFKEAVKFVNRVAVLAEKEGHHPDIRIYSWNRVGFELQTHAIGGLSQNDFIVAAKINKILKK